MVVHAPPQDVAVLAYELAERGIHVSFADDAGVPDTPQRIAELHGAARRTAAGSAQVRRCCAGRKTRGVLRSQARALGLEHHFYYLEPRRGCRSASWCSARTDGATPVKGAVRISATGSLPQRPMRAGDVLVVELDGSAASVLGLERIVSALGRRGARNRAAVLARPPPEVHQRQQQRRARERAGARSASTPARAISGTPPSGVVVEVLAEQQRREHHRDRPSESRTRPARPGSPGAICSALISLSSPDARCGGRASAQRAASARCCPRGGRRRRAWWRPRSRRRRSPRRTSSSPSGDGRTSRST